jgi:hypothetical protein
MTNATTTGSMPALEALDLETLARALLTPEINSHGMVWTVPEAMPETVPQTVAPRSEVGNRGRKARKQPAAKRSEGRKRQKTGSRKRKRSASASTKSNPMPDKQATTQAMQEPVDQLATGESNARPVHAMIMNTRYFEYSEILGAARDAFDAVVSADATCSDGSLRSRFRLRMIRCLLLSSLMQYLQTQPIDSVAIVEDFATHAFELLRRFNINMV